MPLFMKKAMTSYYGNKIPFGKVNVIYLNGKFHFAANRSNTFQNAPILSYSHKM